ncbi:MAG: molybdopterin-dependent oxidoreductase [Theionarchaea archaeon]|nr:molybdopterin-dependent oxidoreductase [Theionarchaea archaeon]MBU7001508.1 molybdopterin-dependent oxidoreductase [Theionarchaea archaeon]MBU7019719.1 molybdopterin-dependent oxidoreductase [Theionarchaea archaeon]MBU7034430.1 molybdopterin-dependent oxidoreductase [Theionarchaea archaeon]MBU7040641.1 molybdopterin-dependent oxidoreductase [Theionarchaea archaeon]
MRYSVIFLVLLLMGCIEQQTESVDEGITPLEDFFVMDSGVIPDIDSTGWVLEVTGLVETQLALTYEEVLQVPSVTQVTHLYCMPGYEGTGKWTGVPLRSVLEKAGYSEQAGAVVIYAADDFYTSISLEKALQEGTILAYQMNGVVLPREHGYPLRLVLPDEVGSKWVKWIVRIEVVE